MIRKILSTEFTHLDDDQFLIEMADHIRAGRRVSSYYANFSQVLLGEKNEQFRNDFQRAEITVPDGVALNVAGYFLEGNPVRLKTVDNTTDFFDRILRYAETEGFSIYFLGGSPTASSMLDTKLLRQYPALKIAGCHHGYFGEESGEIITAINASGAAIVMVGLGSPLQEAWLARHRMEIASPFVMTVGAYITMLSEESKRAPRLLRRLHLEWLYRLTREPSRLWKRYLLGGAFFALLLLRERVRTLLHH